MCAQKMIRSYNNVNTDEELGDCSIYALNWSLFRRYLTKWIVDLWEKWNTFRTA